MAIKREQIVTKAREYDGTPFAHQGRVKGLACDCVGLPLMVAGELGLNDINGQPVNGALYRNYSPQPTGNYVLEICCKHLRRKAVNQLKPGDVLCMKVLTAACHVGIYTGEVNGVPHLIHAYNGGAEKVSEHCIDDRWRKRIVAAFEFPEAED